MIREQKFAEPRVFRLFIIFFVTIIYFLALSLRDHAKIERVVLNFLLFFMFFMIFATMMIFYRTKGKIEKDTSNTYHHFTIFYLCGIILLLFCSLGPAFVAPAFIIGFFFSLSANQPIATFMGAYLITVYSMNVRNYFYEYACNLLLLLIGIFFVEIFEDKRYRSFLYVIVFCVQVSLPICFSHFSMGEYSFWMLFANCLLGIASDLLLYLLFDKMRDVVLEQEMTHEQNIIARDYPLVREIHAYSTAEYEHACKVSLISYKCAKLIDIDPDVCAAAGFYYRIGKLEGEPFVENGVLIAQQHCFPESVIRILHEYNGDKALPSSPESAVVNLVDSLVSRFEYLKQETSESEWNREILIYQTLNDKSSTGIYDKSGLSINQFLKIREFLVRGDDLK